LRVLGREMRSSAQKRALCLPDPSFSLKIGCCYLNQYFKKVLKQDFLQCYVHENATFFPRNGKINLGDSRPKKKTIKSKKMSAKRRKWPRFFSGGFSFFPAQSRCGPATKCNKRPETGQVVESSTRRPKQSSDWKIERIALKWARGRRAKRTRHRLCTKS